MVDVDVVVVGAGLAGLSAARTYAVEWNGYMEGAVRSGRHTAVEILTELP